MKILIQCEECDSEYTIDYNLSCLTDDPQFCVVCKEQVEPIFVEDESEE